jgi:ATP-dependent DNA helicase DinG
LKANKHQDFFKIISDKVPGFELREGQISMFQDVVSAYEKAETLLVEAGTGIGKSLAYLIPAFIWAESKSERSVISTHTIALQEQLLQKDIPFLFNVLGFELKAVLVKGMNNYVCLRKLHDAESEIPESLIHWAKSAHEGSRNELSHPPSTELWERIGAEAETCTYAKCPFYRDCFFFKARKEAEAAQLIIANHHLVFADLVVRSESENYDQAAVLPPYRRLILDEAHHCEDVATHHFADKVSKQGLLRQLGRLFSDRGTGKLVTLYRRICEAYPDGNIFSEIFTILLPSGKKQLTESIHKAFEAIASYFIARSHDDKLRFREHHRLDSLWQQVVQPTVDHVYYVAQDYISTLLMLEGKIKQINDPLLDHKCNGIISEVNGIVARLKAAFETLYSFVFLPLEVSKVRWIEGVPPDLHLMSADLEIADRLASLLFTKVPTIVLCSATLTAQKSFAFFKKRLGITQTEEKIYHSPFNYQKQSLLIVPTDLPDPAHHQFAAIAAERIWEAVRICQGGAFALFTSYAMLKECENILSARFHEEQFLLFCQGDESRFSLLQKFRHASKAVLFGTDSFWEGIDVSGEALRCVIIVKLPFKVPNDPLFQARSEAISKSGGSPFLEYSLPQAIVKFKQGFGRLIRNKDDRGCVVCLDPRLVSKGYGKKFIKSLPECSFFSADTSEAFEKMKNFYLQAIPESQ